MRTLFVFEGAKREPLLMNTLKTLYFAEADTFFCSYGNNIHNLYRELNNAQFQSDIVALLHEKWAGTEQDPYNGGVIASSYSEVYLFFDYDCHDSGKNSSADQDEMNANLEEMLDFFSSETENGKLYINYPMVESIRYTKRLPDPDYGKYEISISDVRNFKRLASEFSDYRNLDRLMLTKKNTKEREGSLSLIGANWKHLIAQNISKANLLCTGVNAFPDGIEHTEQRQVFKKEITDYVKLRNTVSILNSFPLFLLEYFRLKKLEQLLNKY